MFGFVSWLGYPGASGGLLASTETGVIQLRTEPPVFEIQCFALDVNFAFRLGSFAWVVSLSVTT